MRKGSGIAPRHRASLYGIDVEYHTGRPLGLGRASGVVSQHLELLGANVVPGWTGKPMGSPAFDITGHGVRLEAALTGWADGDPTPFDETLAQACSGIMAVHGRATGGPRRLGVDYVSVLGGVLAVQGILAGLLGQLRGIGVRQVSLAVARAAALSLVQYVAQETADEEPDRIEPAELTEDNRPPFTSADGVRFELDTLDADSWREFWAALGAPGAAVARGWRPFMMRYGRATAALPAELSATAATAGFDHIRAVAARAGVSVCRVRTIDERRADPGLWPATGTAAPWELSPLGCAAGRTGQPGPVELPLAGLRVVESARRMQGPFATRLLALLGANVTRIEPPGGEPARGLPPLARGCSAGFVSVNHGKRAVEIDIKTAAGRAEVLDLVRDADVFLHNWAPGKAARLGLDSADLAEANPGLVYAHASGWGRALGDAPPLGTDFQVQAYSGVADRISAGTGLARPTLMIIVDVLGAAVAAEGVLAGLLARQRFGVGVAVDTSLFSAATTLIAEELRRVPSLASETVVDGVFETADGLLAVAARSPDHVARLAALAGCSPRELPAWLGAGLAARPSAVWERDFLEAGVPTVAVLEEVSALPSASRFSSLFEDHGCAVVMAPWRFR
ncbi:MAG TPA: CoA transferase [Amycolatopsis sp.]|uniref:CoA transferase n=1 Tax=Amycolatopsis sp. TaxID=37632 RepID=UPI002B46D344|nr:CoA transferase [Amycolatopsis sp.]HKS47653.1 CoA transferase [Amycolatopsis sp.]